jgi:hypothetical protein
MHVLATAASLLAAVVPLLDGPLREQDYVTPKFVRPAKPDSAFKSSVGKAKKGVSKKTSGKADAEGNSSELVVRFERLGGNDPSPEEELANKLLGEIEAWFDDIKHQRRPAIVKLPDQGYERHGLTRLAGIGYNIAKTNSAVFPYEATVRIVWSEPRGKPVATAGEALVAPLNRHWQGVRMIDFIYQQGKWLHKTRSREDDEYRRP